VLVLFLYLVGRKPGAANPHEPAPIHLLLASAGITKRCTSSTSSTSSASSTSSTSSTSASRAALLSKGGRDPLLGGDHSQ
jgi:hypothetical protein